jgi:hypothetical protein
MTFLNSKGDWKQKGQNNKAIDDMDTDPYMATSTSLHLMEASSMLLRRELHNQNHVHIIYWGSDQQPRAFFLTSNQAKNETDYVLLIDRLTSWTLSH